MQNNQHEPRFLNRDGWRNGPWGKEDDRYAWKTKAGLRGEQLWWLGFDCAHSGDDTPAFSMSGGTYRDVAYVRAEVEKLAAQLAVAT